MRKPQISFTALAVGLAGVLFSTACWTSGEAVAAPYPTRPITLVVPFPPGGGLDVTARILAGPLAKALGQTVVIENSGGAAGSIGVGRVARATADGYTIGIGMWGTHVLNAAMYHLDYDVVKDFAPIGLIATAPQFIEADKSVPANDLKGLVAWLKGRPEPTRMATAGVGSVGQIIGTFFEKETGTHLQFIPYRGLGPARQGLLAGEDDLMIDVPSAALPQVRAGKIKAYAIIAKQRLAAAPGIPTVEEAGMPDLYVSNWYALWAPRGTPQDVITRLNSALVASLADPDLHAKFEANGLLMFPRDQETPEALRALQQSDIKKWWPIVQAAHIALR
jgi:tripartite-type tricarboxylate transporter receptor subunit TctC